MCVGENIHNGEDRKNKKHRMSFAKKAFLIVAVGIMVPVYCIFLYINFSFSSFMDEEISNKVSQLIDGSEERIYAELENMVNISNLFFMDEDFRKVIDNEEMSYYEKCQYFDTVVGQMVNSNMIDPEYMKLTYFDGNNQIYTNWSVNFNNYTFLKDRWKKSCQSRDGYLCWDFFEESPIIEEQGKNRYYISLGRYFGEQTDGILIISMDVAYLNQLLREYCFSEYDHIYICSNENDVIAKGIPEDELNGEVQKIYHELNGKSGTFIRKIKDNKYIVHFYEILNSIRYGQGEFKVLALIDYQNVTEMTNRYMIKNALFLLAFSIFLLLVIYFIIRTVLEPVKDISEKLSTYRVNEEFSYQYTRNDEIGQMYQTFEKMSRRINELFSNLNEEYAVREKYRFESLRAQINPHFIFNTLNSIRWMAMIRKEDNIVESIDALTDILQYSMGKGSDEVMLCQELESVTAYVQIQNLRYGGLCRLEKEIPEELNHCRIIKFSLQPIVENCFIHGFKDGGKEEWIRISGHREEDRLILEIENSGVPVTDEEISRFEEQKQNEHRDIRKVTGIGMNNVDQIIQITYGKEYGLHMEKRENRTVVKYVLPFIHGEEEPEGDESEKNYHCR